MPWIDLGACCTQTLVVYLTCASLLLANDLTQTGPKRNDTDVQGRDWLSK